MIVSFAWVTLSFAALTTASFLLNFVVFRRSPKANDKASLPAVSVLIPARDEAAGIRTSLNAVLQNRDVELEVVVLDDQSDDETSDIVADVARRDDRVRLVQGVALPQGWCGKQFACHQLAEHARHSELLFLDADVRLAPDAIRRSLLQRRLTNADLLSGFPRQDVRTIGESLLIPLMHIVLLTYLPFQMMRRTRRVSASAGCGQLFLTSRQAYRQSGGHAAIRASMHDGVTLPRAYRRAGLVTDVFDASDIGQCRMYDGWHATVQGLLKNAHEGIASARLILPATSLMVMGYLAPTGYALYQLIQPASVATRNVALAAAAISYVPRVLTALRFDRSWTTVALFPVSILLFVSIQWLAYVRLCIGTRAKWRGRSYTPTSA